MAASACEQPDWRSLYEQAHTRAEKERARADAAQALAPVAEVAARHLPEQAEGGLRRRRSGARRRTRFSSRRKWRGWKTPFTSRHRVEQAQHDHVAAHGGRPAGRGEGLAGPGREPGRAACQASRDWERVVKALYGRKSEQQEKPRSGRKRGQQRGAAGHGRTQRPGLEERTEEHNPPADARVCSCCAKPYVANGERSSTVIEIEVKAHTRDRPSPVAPELRLLEVSAPPPRLFPNTPAGSASGHASCSSTVPASGPCTALARGCPTRGFRSRRGRWPTL